MDYIKGVKMNNNQTMENSIVILIITVIILVVLLAKVADKLNHESAVEAVDTLDRIEVVMEY